MEERRNEEIFTMEGDRGSQKYGEERRAPGQCALRGQSPHVLSSLLCSQHLG